MNRVWVFLFCVVLTACGTAPVVTSPARIVAERSHRMALQAIQDGRIESAEGEWQQALRGYQAIDDWRGQGMARLGLAQASQRLGRGTQAEQALLPMLQEGYFLPEQQVQAALQLAQLIWQQDLPRAQRLLAQVRLSCVAPCFVAVQMDNLAAQIALEKGDVSAAAQFATQALDLAKERPAERAFALRLLAEVALLQGRWLDAEDKLMRAIDLDRQSAEPMWLLDDYRLLLKIAKRKGDVALEKKAQAHLGSLCAAIECSP
ncbi:tetratricopeptide repeat protein [Deefgea piscis]|uniref:tetratricopeptide repeat protein n=1 Tax=Deefgea piscis TaxID=2739061 RepID=UPI001C7EE686|nr:hypothetical protein [Deefgea piscis]QZA79990.1 hypothetical protein K4H25_10590 [Deefgea piscis]